MGTKIGNDGRISLRASKAIVELNESGLSVDRKGELLELILDPNQDSEKLIDAIIDGDKFGLIYAYFVGEY